LHRSACSWSLIAAGSFDDPRITVIRFADFPSKGEIELLAGDPHRHARVMPISGERQPELRSANRNRRTPCREAAAIDARRAREAV
jgi:hypothetical protein